MVASIPATSDKPAPCRVKTPFPDEEIIRFVAEAASADDRRATMNKIPASAFIGSI